ncbi:MAG: 3-methyl-2-oxobutanoate hydroxymethyltransferase [Gammaproteobacteria bacterium]|nr:3-methyl-2-oxobutanoate hydroxymethyltransferase [Gammaproteobacteria bacterium]
MAESTSEGSRDRKPVDLLRIAQMHRAGEKIAMLTCYDAAFARLLDEAGVDALLVGDSLGMVIQGRAHTLPVTMDEMVYHTACVARGNRSAWLLADMPFGSYQESAEQAIRNAARLFQAGAQMVKIEGGGWTAATVHELVVRGMPVCAHLGFTPQSVHALGGYRIQGRDAGGAETLLRHAKELVDAGAQMLLFELVPSALARELCAQLPVPTIGIGAGSGCAGQVLVLHDMLDVTPGRRPRFVRNFLEGGASIQEAVRRYVRDVKSGAYPVDSLHGY